MASGQAGTQNLKLKVGAACAALLIPLVAGFEGLRQKAYLDAVGIPTICFGATAGVRLGDTATIDQCKDLLAQDLLTAATAVESCVHVPLADNQRAAFVSFTYNVGGRAFCGSTLVRKLNAKDYNGACAELSKWVTAKGLKLPGLVKRRAAERALCEGKQL